MILWNNFLKHLSCICPLIRSTTVSTMRLMCIGSTGGGVMGLARPGSLTLATWRGPWTGLRLVWTLGGRTTRELVVGRTPRSKSLKDTAKKARRTVNRMGKPQRRRPLEMKSFQVQLQVMSLFLRCMFCFNTFLICPMSSNQYQDVLLGVHRRPERIRL